MLLSSLHDNGKLDILWPLLTMEQTWHLNNLQTKLPNLVLILLRRQLPLLSTMLILLTKLLLSDNLLLVITVDIPDISLPSAMHEDKINNLKDPDNQNELLEVLIKTTLVVIIVINLTLEVEIITEIEVGHKTETTIDLTEPLLENIVEKDLTVLSTDHLHPTIAM